MKEILQSAVLGIVQGLTEFLPVSSSGHLVLVESLFNFKSPGAFYETILHLGTLVAVVFYFRDYIKTIRFSEIKLLIVATIPAAIIGVLFKDPIESLFNSTKLVGVALLFTALINYLMEKQSGKKEKPDLFDSVVVGFAQAVAIIPGISRSGSTILAGRSMKLDPEVAARFSFLMSIPIILGANLVQIASHGFEITSEIPVYLVGLLTSFLAGVFSIGFLMAMIKEKKMRVFSVYLVIVGLIAILLI